MAGWGLGERAPPSMARAPRGETHTSLPAQPTPELERKAQSSCPAAREHHGLGHLDNGSGRTGTLPVSLSSLQFFINNT